ncbi:MAG: RNA polymerase sigma factor [bacterium]
MKEFSVERVIALCRKGDTNAFDILAAHYGRRLYNFIYSVVGNHQSTDEVLQETFIKVFTCIKKYTRDAAFSHWLYKIAYNQCLDHIKSESRRTAREKLYCEDCYTETSDDREVEKLALRRDDQLRLVQALQKLSEKQRTAICLFTIGGFSIKEAGWIMGCSDGAVMSHLHRARQNLRTYLTNGFTGNDTNKKGEIIRGLS